MPDTKPPPGSWRRLLPALGNMIRDRRIHPALAAWLEERRATSQRLVSIEALHDRSPEITTHRSVSAAIASNVVEVMAGLGLTDVESRFPQEPEGSIEVDVDNAAAIVKRLADAGLSTLPSGDSIRVWHPRSMTRGWVAGAELAAILQSGSRSATFPPMDAVITWVDGSDPTWRNKMMAAEGATSHRLSSNESRFNARGQLRYVLRSINDYIPWIRRVFLVTDEQIPAWLTPGDDLVLVDHREILPAEALPTFNSHAIESALHRIPHLSEHFIYFNDDTFVGLPLGQAFFFAAPGRPIYASAPIGVSSTNEDPVSLALVNAKELLDPGRPDPLERLDHSPRPLLRSALLECEELFADPVSRTRANQFRSGRDVSMLSQLGPHFLIQKGTAGLVDRPETYINIASRWAASLMRQLLNGRKDATFTLNDTQTPARRDRRIDRDVGRFLESYFPFPSPWES